MNTIVVINQNTNVTNNFLRRVSEYRTVNKIIVINYLLSSSKRSMVLKNDKIIEINCDDETEGYSCVINCGLKYISEHFKNSNII